MQRTLSYCLLVQLHQLLIRGRRPSQPWDTPSPPTGIATCAGGLALVSTECAVFGEGVRYSEADGTIKCENIELESVNKERRSQLTDNSAIQLHYEK